MAGSLASRPGRAAGSLIIPLKQQPGPGLHTRGSGDLLQTLLRHDLVDAFWLMIYPLTLGAGKRLSAGGALPWAFAVTESQVTPQGGVVVNYERAGAVKGRDQ